MVHLSSDFLLPYFLTRSISFATTFDFSFDFFLSYLDVSIHLVFYFLVFPLWIFLILLFFLRLFVFFYVHFLQITLVFLTVWFLLILGKRWELNPQPFQSQWNALPLSYFHLHKTGFEPVISVWKTNSLPTNLLMSIPFEMLFPYFPIVPVIYGVSLYVWNTGGLCCIHSNVVTGKCL